jgi:DNA-binding transcriptional MerR regulator
VNSDDLSEPVDGEDSDLSAARADGPRRSASKSDAAFRTISEVADELNVPQHVLRFWETKFNQIRPLKRGGGRRYYRPEDVSLLKRIRTLLYTDGLTIKGVQKLLRETGVRAAPVDEVSPPEGLSVAEVPMGLARDEAVRLLAELKALRDDLQGALARA